MRDLAQASASATGDVVRLAVDFETREAAHADVWRHVRGLEERLREVVFAAYVEPMTVCVNARAHEIRELAHKCIESMLESYEAHALSIKRRVFEPATSAAPRDASRFAFEVDALVRPRQATTTTSDAQWTMIERGGGVARGAVEFSVSVDELRPLLCAFGEATIRELIAEFDESAVAFLRSSTEVWVVCLCAPAADFRLCFGSTAIVVCRGSRLGDGDEADGAVDCGGGDRGRSYLRHGSAAERRGARQAVRCALSAGSVRRWRAVNI
jgi:hypothetical protein